MPAPCTIVQYYLCFSLLASACMCQTTAPSAAAAAAQAKKKLAENPLFMTDLDVEHLYDEWEENDEDKLAPDELPIHKRPVKAQEPINEALLKDPEKLMQASKKGKTVMAFVSIANNPTKEETEALTQRWQVGLTNNHMKCERFVIADDRAIFVFQDGQMAFEAKDFMVEQPELREYSIDGRAWHGRASLARKEL